MPFGVTLSFINLVHVTACWLWAPPRVDWLLLNICHRLPWICFYCRKHSHVLFSWTWHHLNYGITYETYHRIRTCHAWAERLLPHVEKYILSFRRIQDHTRVCWGSCSVSSAFDIFLSLCLWHRMPLFKIRWWVQVDS